MGKKKKAEMAVAVVPESKESSEVGSLISQALSANASVETLERLFELRSKVNAENAKAEFVSALSKFQTDVPVINKTKKVHSKDGSLRYTYASLDSIVEQIKKPLAANGLSYRWDTVNESDGIRAICVVTHVLGHSESSSFTVPKDESQYMTNPQRYASALTFAKRYALLNALGVSTADEDTDATDVDAEKDPRSPKSKIMFLLRNLGEKTNTKEEIAAGVKKITKLELSDDNLDEVVKWLEIAYKDRHEN